MRTKQTTINGKQVTLAYCYATEINFSNLTNGEKASLFIADAAMKIDAISKGTGNEAPDIEKCIKLVLAAAIAYSMSKGEECPIKDEDFLYIDDSTELFKALGQVILLYGEFYNLTPEDKPKEEEGQQGKN